MSTPTLTELKSLSAKIASELVFAEAGQDLGLLPVNSLLGQVEELIAKEGLAEPLTKATILARQWVDAIFETTGIFSDASLKRLGEWAAWLQAAVEACENGQAPASLPGDWEKGTLDAAP